MTNTGRAIACLLAACALPAAAAAAPARADRYNLFVTGGMTGQGSDTEGAVAVGGIARLENYSVGALARGGAADLVVGGDATIRAGSTDGTIAVGGDASFRNYGVGARLPAGTRSLTVGGALDFVPGSIRGTAAIGGGDNLPVWWDRTGYSTVAAPLPVNFAREGVRLRTIADTLGAMATNGTVSAYDDGGPKGLQLTLTGTDSALNVFSLSAAQAAGSNTFRLDVAPGSIALVNIAGTAASMTDAGFLLNGGAFGEADYGRVLFNFHQATSLSFGGIDVSGSVLAPRAAYTGGNGGVINGQMFVASFAGGMGTTTQVNSRWFAGDLLRGGAVPEPATWATMLLGSA